MKRKIFCAVVFAALFCVEAHAAFLPPIPYRSAASLAVSAAEDLPSKYDLREHNRVTPIRAQSPWGTCWAYAAIAACESNYLTDTGEDPETVDFSEMFLVWFSRLNQDKSWNFSMYDRNKAKLKHMGDYGMALEEGAYPNIAIASLARLEGPVNEETFPYLSREYFARKGFNASNPPTHEEAESAGLIPFRTSTHDEIKYSDKTNEARKDFFLADAIFSATIITPSSFANQNALYALVNSVYPEKLKKLIMEYGAAMVGYYSAEKVGKNFSPIYHSYYDDSKNWRANHEITIVGWDDDFPKEHFVIQPPNNGAWLARNNWGNFAGSDGGYEWISYEQLMGDGTVCHLIERPEEVRVYSYDPLGWCNSYTYNEKVIYGANVFKAKSDGELLTAVSTYTTKDDMQLDISIYDLGANFEGGNPTSGTLIAQESRTIEDPGYHSIGLLHEVPPLKQGHYFSVVIKYTCNASFFGESMDASVPIEVAIKGYSNNAAVYDHESYFADIDGVEWTDGTDMVDDFHGGIPYHVNACIKAFTIWSADEVPDTSAKTIQGLAVEDFRESYYTEINTTASSPAGKITLSPEGIAANSEVLVYLADKTRTYEPIKYTSTTDDIDELFSKGLNGPSEWALVPVYEAGYKPDAFWNDEGINYPVYGPFVVTSDGSGKVTVDVDALKYSDGRTGKVPQRYYTAYIEPDDGATSEIGVFQLTATTGSAPATPSTDNNGSTDNNSTDSNTTTTSSGGGSSGGCNSGIFCAIALLLVLRQHKELGR